MNDHGVFNMKLKQICIIIPALLMLTCCGNPADVPAQDQTVTTETAQSADETGAGVEEAEDGEEASQEADGQGETAADETAADGSAEGESTDPEESGEGVDSEDENSEDGEEKPEEAPDGTEEQVPDLDGNTGDGSQNDDDQGCIGDEGLVW